MTLTVKKGQIEIVKTDRANLVEAKQTYDGIILIFKENFTVSYTDNYMPTPAKDLIINTLNSFITANITVDLSNYNKPVFASV